MTVAQPTLRERVSDALPDVDMDIPDVDADAPTEGMPVATVSVPTAAIGTIFNLPDEATCATGPIYPVRTTLVLLQDVVPRVRRWHRNTSARRYGGEDGRNVRREWSVRSVADLCRLPFRVGGRSPRRAGARSHTTNYVGGRLGHARSCVNRRASGGRRADPEMRPKSHALPDNRCCPKRDEVSA